MELFGEEPYPSLPSSPEASGPPALLSQTSPSDDSLEDDPEPELTILDVLKIINMNHANLMGKVTELKLYITIMRQNMHKIQDRVSDMERGISDFEDTVNPVLPVIKTCGTKIKSLEDKNLENRLLRNNLPLVGQPERVEGSDPVSFLADHSL